jgi:hypothetical protein
MTWAPLALAVLFGLIVSAGIYFTIMWPDVEPIEEEDGEENGHGHGHDEAR